MTFSWISLALASQARNLAAEYPDGDLQLEHMADAWGGPLAPARGSLPDLVRELAGQGVRAGAVPVSVVDDQTQPNPIVRGRAGEVRAGVGGQYHGFLIRPRALTRVTLHTIRWSVDPAVSTPDVQIYVARSVPLVGGIAVALPTLSLTIAPPTLQVHNLRTNSAPTAGVPLPFNLEGDDAPVVLRGTADDDAAGEALEVWVGAIGAAWSWQIEWSEEPLPASQAYTP